MYVKYSVVTLQACKGYSPLVPWILAYDLLLYGVPRQHVLPILHLPSQNLPELKKKHSTIK